MNIKCLFGFHKLEFSEYDRPMPNTLANGEIFGFLHFGKVSRCKNCHKYIDSDNLNLPIIMPTFKNCEFHNA